MKKYLVLASTLFIVYGCGSSDTTTPMQKDELSVKVNLDKTNFAEGENIVFDSNVTGYEGAVTYEWREGNLTLGTDANLSKSDFTLGNHTVVLNVENGDKKASDSKSIMISEFLVSLTSSKIVYNLDNNMTLDTNITGTLGSVITYNWADKWTKVDNSVEDKNLTQTGATIVAGDFGVGKHEVTVTVNSDGVKKSGSVDFSVYDLNQTIVSGDGVIVQNSKNLMWVSDDDTSKEACLAIKNDGNYTISQTFCENLTFAGSMDWRKPKTSEVIAFIKDTVTVGILPAYYAPCKILIGTNSAGADEAVVTRYGAGKSGFGELGAVIPVKYNIGLRCVRDN